MAMKQSNFSPRTEGIGGYIFACSRYSLPEFLEREILGLPGHHYEFAQRIRPGTPFFFYNYSSGCLHGIFEFTSSGGWNIDPYAWPIIDNNPGSSFYPAQIRIRCRKDCPPLPQGLSNRIMARLRATDFSDDIIAVELPGSEARWIIILFEEMRLESVREISTSC